MKSAAIDVRWLVSLGMKVARAVFWKTITIILLTLISQISAVLASFLPLKVIILLGSEGVPRYIPDAISVHGKDLLIIIFSVLTLGFYLVHVFAEKLIGIATQRATKELSRRSRKLVLYENQEGVAEDAYLRFSRTLSGIVFFLLALLSLAVMYPLIASIVVLYALILSLLFSYMWSNSERFRYKYGGSPTAFFKVSSSIGFFVVFGSMVGDFIIAPAPGIISAIVSILLTRIMLQKFSGSWVDMINLTKRRLKLEPLFFQGKYLKRMPKSEVDQKVWTVLEGDLVSFVDSVMVLAKVDWLGSKDVSWYQTGIKDVVGLKITDKSGCLYLMKVHGKNRNNIALHEATILSEKIPGLPALPFVGKTTFKGFICNIYRADFLENSAHQETKFLIEKAQGALLAVEPTSLLVESFARSHPLLSKRLTYEMLSDLRRCASGNQNHSVVDAFAVMYDALKRFVDTLPVVFNANDLGTSSLLYCGQTGEVKILNWGRWSVDTIGSGWRVAPKKLRLLKGYMKRAEVYRPELKSVQPEEVELVAFLSALEARCSKQLYSDALALIPDILEHVRHIRRWHEFDMPEKEG